MGKYSFGPMTAELYANHRVSRHKWDAVEDLARRYSVSPRHRRIFHVIVSLTR